MGCFTIGPASSVRVVARNPCILLEVAPLAVPPFRRGAPAAHVRELTYQASGKAPPPGLEQALPARLAQGQAPEGELLEGFSDEAFEETQWHW